MDPEQPRRILTVCLGNHCRSPLAAAVLAQLGGDRIETLSAGIRGKWTGKAADPAMVEAAALRGYDLSGHRGAQISPDLMAWADVILAMDSANLSDLQALADESTVPKLGMYLADQDVPDPYRQDAAAFARCTAIIEAGAARHLQDRTE